MSDPTPEPSGATAGTGEWRICAGAADPASGRCARCGAPCDSSGKCYAYVPDPGAQRYIEEAQQASRRALESARGEGEPTHDRD